jgi:4-hydroxy-2-oxoheptanedioate aldolase
VSALPRLNGVIRAWETNRPALSAFAQADRQSAIGLSTAPYDSVIFEMEHNPWDMNALSDALQYLLSKQQIAAAGSLACGVTPLVRVPANGREMNQAYAKQALDRGAYGIVWPHVATVEQACNAVSACRYARPRSAPLYEPVGQRGDGPSSAARYWGLSQADYYAKADVWPLAPEGEILVGLMIESVEAIENLDDILSNVPGIGLCLIGEGDLSQELGRPRQYDHPEVLDAMARIVSTCRRHKVAVGNPHTTAKNVDRLVDEGYTFLMQGPVKTYPAIERVLARFGVAKADSGSGASY